jgi:AcrR family transcriptional regulator
MGTREKILEAAAWLFSTRGYAATSLAQVARAAQVSKALVLWYFESKEHLFRAALQHFLTPYEIDAQVLLGLNEYEQVDKLIDDYYDFVADHLPSVKFVLGQVVRGDETSAELVAHVSALYGVYRDLLTSILERGCERHVFPAYIKPAQDAALIMAALNGLLLQHLVEPEGSPMVRDLRTYLKQLVRVRLCAASTQADTSCVVPPASPRREA